MNFQGRAIKVFGVLMAVGAAAVAARASINRAGETPDYGKGGQFEVYLPNMQPGFEPLIMLRIPAGSFQMGSTESDPVREENELPAREVTLSRDFYMGKFEVTQAQWLALMDGNPSTMKGPNLPVNKVNWHDCRDFIERLNQYANETRFRLPTEAEREYACRAGGEGSAGGAPDREAMAGYAWFRDNSEGLLHPVGQLKPNPWGLHDLFGNVWEWCLDWYGPYPDGPAVDPVGPESGGEKVFRGASWMGRFEFLRCADRGKFTPDQRRNTGGFRLVWSEFVPEEAVSR